MKVLVACEFSGVVRDAFIKKGHDAISCDLLDSDRPGPHIKGSIENVNMELYDMVIAHPPCTYLARSGARWWKGKENEQLEAMRFFEMFFKTNVPKISVENPIGKMSTAFRKPDQIIQPWQFGHGETKSTCLWLRGLPKLTPTNIVEGRTPKVHFTPPSKDRWKIRSITYQGIADAMAEQWG